jgi:GT2 family glycosyltransferase
VATTTFSVLIITYNRPADLLELLQSIRMQEHTDALAEILILNNASTESYDEVEHFIRQHPYLKINYIKSAENLGVSRGRNKLMQMARGEWLLIVDDDILFVRPGDMRQLASVIANPFFVESNTSIITLRVIYHSTKEVQQTAFPHKRFEEYKDRPVFLTYYFAGCAHLLRREILSVIGYYPEDFFYGMEEYDLAYRAINAGYSLGYDNSVTFEHKESPFGRQAQYQKLASQWVNKTKVARRYLPFRYYLTTMAAWSIEYIRRSGGHWGTWFRSWIKGISAGVAEKRNPLNKSALDYLKKVKARLWY